MKSFVHSLCVDHGLKTYFETQVSTAGPKAEVHSPSAESRSTTGGMDQAGKGRMWPEHWQDQHHEEDGGEGH